MRSILMVVTCWLVAAAYADDSQKAGDLLQKEFEAFKLKYSKRYASEAEEQIRLQNYLQSRQRVAAHNARYAQGLVGYWLGINEFSDMDRDEFAKTHLGYRKKSNDEPRRKALGDATAATFIPPEHVVVADEVDWRKEGAVTPVKNQRYCGSCWAFGATGSIEGQHFRKTGELISLSEQNLIDCSTMYDNMGCKGGLPKDAFQYVKDNGGINPENYYPYNPHESWCIYNSTESVAEVTGYVQLPEGDEEMLKLAVATVGPVSVGVHALHFEDYTGGIFKNSTCGNQPEDIDHAVLVVGYGTEEGEDYWLIKNSWGLSWGIEGYMKLARNLNNLCAVATSASYPLV